MTPLTIVFAIAALAFAGLAFLLSRTVKRQRGTIACKDGHLKRFENANAHLRRLAFDADGANQKLENRLAKANADIEARDAQLNELRSKAAGLANLASDAGAAIDRADKYGHARMRET